MRGFSPLCALFMRLSPRLRRVEACRHKDTCSRRGDFYYSSMVHWRRRPASSTMQRRAVRDGHRRAHGARRKRRFGERLPGVERWIDVNTLHFACIRLLQRLEREQVIPLNQQVVEPVIRTHARRRMIRTTPDLQSECAVQGADVPRPILR